MNKKVSIWLLGAVMSAVQLGAQQPVALEPWKYHVFSQDSLAGFDEQAAGAAAISEGFVGAEYPVRMYDLKRQYIDAKYNLVRPRHQEPPIQSGQVSAACVNEDFEASSAGQITASNQIMGWTITRGQNSGSSGGTSNNSCNLGGCCPSQPSVSALIDAPNGYTDPKIGACYKIYSVFGDGPGNTAANAANPHIPFPMRGSKFIRINDDYAPDRSIEKLSKTFSVTPANALFQFAFISVFAPGHDCCQAGAFKISLPGISCPTFSASAPSGQCSNTLSSLSFSVIPRTSSNCSTLTACSSFTNLNDFCVDYIYTDWQISSMDLTAYIGQTITIDIVASDCTAGGHAGYVYFDAQCGPMAVLGNGVPYPAGDTNVVIPTCGPNGATICATPGLGPYKWEGPGIPASYAVYSYTNQCFTTSVSAQYTLYMNPPGGCAPFTRIVNTTVTPAPTMIGNVVQATCGGSLAVASVTTGGSAGNPKFIEWFPPPHSISTNSASATFTIPPVGQPPEIITVSAADQIGCPVTITLAINPPAPIPTFTVQNTTGTSQLTCLNDSINLVVNTTYTYGAKQYFWSSSSFTSAAPAITVTNPGTFVISLSDPVSLCASQQTVVITANKQMPNSSISPTLQTITCATGPTVITLTAVSPTINFEHVVMSPLGGSYNSNSTNALYQAGTPGTYTHHLVNLTNGCRTIKQFTISSTEGFPIFSLTSQRNFTIGCESRNWTDVNILNAQATPTNAGSVSYTLLTPSGGTALPGGGTLSAVAAYTINTPGSYTVVTRNNANGCDTRIPVSIITNTLPPGIDSIIMPTSLLTCYTPSTVIRGISKTPNVSYRWFLPGNSSQTGDQYTSQANFANRTETLLATYTLQVTDNSSECVNTQTVDMLQDLFPPVTDISGEGPISCNTPTLQLSNNSERDPANPHPGGKPMSAYLWEGPSPSVPLQNSSSYIIYYPGTYTMYVRDENNGCTATATAVVQDNFVYPVLYNAQEAPPFTLGCGDAFSTVSVGITNTVSVPKIVWSAVDIGNKPFTFDGDNEDVVTFTPHNPGIYEVAVTEITSGCLSTTTVQVLPDTIAVSFTADKTEGYAPLTVNFTNTSETRLGPADIQGVWIFGNAQVADTMGKSLTTTYTQPGTYTVGLYASKGQCLDTAFMVITVDIPSELVIPNVFSPNGDGVNDVFRLQRSSNLSQVKVSIYDRWGNLAYEVDSPTGQISWDGKNQYGKESPAGTYYFILNATGRDGKTYEQKGTLTLVR